MGYLKTPTLCSNLKIMICSLSGPGGRENYNLEQVCVREELKLYIVWGIQIPSRGRKVVLN